MIFLLAFFKRNQASLIFFTIYINLPDTLLNMIRVLNFDVINGISESSGKCKVTESLRNTRIDAQFAGSSSVPAHVEMMGLIGAGNNPMVGMTVAVAVSIEEAAKAGKF